MEAESGFSVLELACGRGGDVGKWVKAGATEYFGIDISK